VNPASLDLRLGNQIRLPAPIWQTLNGEQMTRMILSGEIRNLPHWSEPLDFDTFWLMPQGKGVSFVLCASLEYVNIPDDSIALLFSKSSTGRIGLEHLHAGYGDCGFSGTWTWELHNVAPWPIELIAGKRLMQQVMIKMTDKPLRTYQETGRYNGQIAPTPMRNEKAVQP
jgi:deoxycytidine triphosphate deaminase